MTRDWKPGDVAMVGHRLYENSEELTHKVRILRSDGKWHGATGWVMNIPEAAISIRPLVVIDPEDREQVERFTYLFLEHHWGSEGQTHTDAARAALREFADPRPPKPDEPKGLGSWVEDEDGVHYVRGDEHSVDPWLSFKNGLPYRDHWANIKVAKVLFDAGVSDD